MKTTRGNRLHIGFFGKMNVGKSSLVNKIIGRNLSIVSDTKGTTTDVNEKAMELLPIGPVVLMDTAGFDDKTEVGKLRVQKTLECLERCDVAVVVFDFSEILPCDIELLQKLKKKSLKTLIILNKEDEKGTETFDFNKIEGLYDSYIQTSALLDEDFVKKFKAALIKILPDDFLNSTPLLSDLVGQNEVCLLVIPIDKEAPKGRLILPQVNALRDLLDYGAISVVCRDFELEDALKVLKSPPKLVVIDSQAFKKVSEIVPDNIPLTSFSIVFARLKGNLNTFVKGALALDSLKDGDKILILESCSHHPIEDDIGRVKIPNLIKKYTGLELEFEHFSGHSFPSDIKKYSLIIHCGACMTNRREVLNRIEASNEENVPISNYGVIIAKCLGILDRVISPFNIENRR